MGNLGKNFALVFIGLFLMSFIVGMASTGLGASVSDNFWDFKNPMLTGRADFGLAQVNGKIYAIGGYPDLNITEEYDPATDLWTTKSAMPTARCDFAIVVFENKIFCIGGLVVSRSGNFYQSSEVSGAIEVYEPASDTWKIKQPMPTPTAKMEANVVDGKIYLIGGRTGGQYTTVATTQVYDPISESWEQKAPMPYPITSYASVTVDGKIYVMGGQDEFSKPMDLNTTQIYDTKKDSWSLGKPFAYSLIDSAACTLPSSNTIYLIGGYVAYMGGDSGSTSTVQVYDVDNDTWVFGPSMHTARFKLSVAVLENKIYAMGGTGNYMFPTDQASDENEMLVVNNESSLPTPTPAVPEFSWLALIPLFTSMLSTAVILRHRKKTIT